MNKFLSVVMLSALLFSCAQAPTPNIHYYLLNTPVINEQVKKTAVLDPSAHIELDRVLLPQYLKQQSLVMLIGENQLHYARYHLWGESLAHGIAKYIRQAVNHLNIQDVKNAKTLKLTIEIDHFYPTDQAQVILSGRYFFKNKFNKKRVFEFAFKQALRADGYSQAVKQMHALIEQLTQKIIRNGQALDAKHEGV
ncbi:MAG: hypothetical protein COB35_05205 [Gammaproteobacteria bacterium]|nr:MAG: hypothetical protein COB35_05205 [Gammaproteobacteria bacterium]